MPQMAPMSWLFISPLTIFISLLTMAAIYFSFNVLPNKNNDKLKINKIHPPFKW